MEQMPIVDSMHHTQHISVIGGFTHKKWMSQLYRMDSLIKKKQQKKKKEKKISTLFSLKRKREKTKVYIIFLVHLQFIKNSVTLSVRNVLIHLR